MRKSVLLIWATCLVLALSACSGNEENPFSVESVQDLGVLEFAPSIRGRDGGYSTLFQERSVWLFGDTMLDVEAEDGQTWRTSTFATTEDLDPSAGLPSFDEPLDEQGAPYLFIQYTDEEQAHNQRVEDTDEHPWIIWPMDVVALPETGEALVFYMKLQDWENQGTSIAVWRDLEEDPQRAVVRPETEEPTLLFQGDDPRLGTAAVLHDGWLYAYRCENECRLGRVSPSDALKRDAWTFYAGDGRWSPDQRDAEVVTTAAQITSIRWHEALNRFLAIYADGEKVVMRSAPTPEGPWSEAVELFEPLHHEDEGHVYDAIEHAELASPDSRTLYVSYSRRGGFFLSEMRLVEVRLGDVAVEVDDDLLESPP